MREVSVKTLTEEIATAVMWINFNLEPDTASAFCRIALAERDPVAREVMEQLAKNLEVASKEQIPICQDTGMAVVFLEVGQDVHFTDGDLYTAVNEGVRKGYVEGFLRKSVVSDPFDRVNTGDNTPAVIHTDIVPGDKVKVTVSAKGFGSENKSRVFMLNPADGEEGVRAAVLQTVREAGASACPPMTLGVGIGGNFEKCALMAKHALLREKGESAANERDARLERELLDEINKTGIGPAGLGGDTTALAVNVETCPTHIAGLPVAVNVCCHVNRHKTIII